MRPFPTLALLAVAAATSCATTRSTQPLPSPAPSTEPTAPEPPAPPPPPPPFSLEPTSFSTVSGWATADLAPALAALRRSCASWRQQPPQTPLRGGKYGGTVSQWLPACAAADSVPSGGERAFFEANFAPHAVVGGGGETKLTAYYEPMINVRHIATGPYTAPLLKKPADLVSVDLAAFAEAQDDDALRGARRSLTGQLLGNTVKPYPKREAIQPQPQQVIAYAHPADLYNLQVQGSGRIRFEDGEQARAAYASQNGYKWQSALRALQRSGELPAASWAQLRSWMDAHGADASHQALNADPSYVFFDREPIEDESVGPRGAANVHLTPLGSLAVDPAFHPYGALLYVNGTYDNQPFQRLLAAQDTGGAIRRGPLRGDVFFGTGPQAGLQAERMNSPAQFWTLLPLPPKVAALK